MPTRPLPAAMDGRRNRHHNRRSRVPIGTDSRFSDIAASEADRAPGGSVAVPMLSLRAFLGGVHEAARIYRSTWRRSCVAASSTCAAQPEPARRHADGQR
jgi:hypothetical protein